MQVHYQIDQLPTFKNAVITIGAFDGVHEGHRIICAALNAQAKQSGGESIIISFEPHPRKIVQPQVPLQLLTTLPEKIALLRKTGIDHLVIAPFTPGFANQDAEAYIEDFLIRHFNPACIIIGYDHHFGKNREGNFLLLQANAKKHGYQLVEIPKHILNEIAVSSTMIRNAILAGNVTAANQSLGYPFFFEGKVVSGDRLGRELGYPTANLEYVDGDKIHLGHGVYAVYVEVDGERRKGMMSIGTRPTLEKSAEKTEVNIFDFDDDIYGKTIKVIAHKYLRPQEAYPNLEALVAQLHQDKKDSLTIL